MRPRSPRDEEHRADGRAVNERRAEVRLEEDEEDRDRREPERGERSADLVQASRALCQEAGERKHEQDLAELGRLEAEEAQVEPALGTANRAGKEDDRDQERGAAEDHTPPRPVEIRIDERRDEQTQHADDDVDRLARQVVALVARDVVMRDPRDRPEPVPDERRDAADQDPVEAPDEGSDLGRLAAAGAGCCTGVGGVVDHQSEWIGPVGVACLPKNDSKTLSAAGAAASPPCPPFSIKAQTTRSGESEGP